MSNRLITCTAAILIATMPALSQAPTRAALMMRPTDLDPGPVVTGGQDRRPKGPVAPAPARHATRMMNSSDPNLDPNWQWWLQEAPTAIYFSPYGQTPQMVQVRLPWYTDGNILKGYELDIYPEDGWVLAFKDFGTPTQAPQFPYFALYNKYRGKFRLMVYKPYEQNSTHYMAELKFMNDIAGQPRSTALLTFRAAEQSFLDNYNPTQVDACIAQMNVYGSWGIFDFDLAGYDPKLDDPAVDPVIQVAIRGVSTSHVQLGTTGNFQLDQILSAASLATTRDQYDDLKKAVTTGSKYYKDVKDFQGDFKKATDDIKNKDEWWISAAKEIAPLALSAYAPYAAALVGFASEFLGGSHKSAPLEPMHFKGLLDLQTTGTITDNQAVLAPFDLFLKPGPQSSLAQRPIQAIPWGVYNWTSKPKITWEDRYNEIWRTELDGQGIPYQERDTNEYVNTQISSTVPDVVINPKLDMTLVSKKATYYTGDADQNSNNIKNIELPFGSSTCVLTLDNYNNSPYMEAWHSNGQGMARPIQMGLELTFRINGGVLHSDKEIKIIKAYPTIYAITTKRVDVIPR